ncbi:type VI secretion system protein TssL [Sulfitobacter sabulilitoris]|uniref:Type VI secretion system protein TssL n=2 Tax=Sulfitobacter sabulilitoris TaxID=2562655 RepID=A0A5S3PMB9_9RHOB|nr:type IVB secretion system protein IcmH/DotU [Sulfitobacter sabulilitoris]TMM55558.1 type VI secretion system protein TssL [Sulfitobacter sabulilitoris]
MSDDDPFAEPSDTDRTVIRPNPGGRRPAVAAAAPAPAAPAPQTQEQPRQPGADAASGGPALTGMNPLNAAAATLFALVSRIRNRAQHPDPDALRRSVVAEVRAFEARALQERIDPAAIKVARYAICATLDDVVLNTPWGGASQWAQQSMVATFHRETVGGDRFYDLLARLEQDPGRNIDMLEFLFMCLSLGFEGRLRVEDGGADKHVEIRRGLARIIRTQRGEAERTLSPHWMGLDIPHRVLSAWKPFWLSVAAVAAVLGAGFMVLSYLLNAQSQNLIGQLSVLDPGGIATLERRAPPVVVPAAPADDAALKRVTEFLQPEIDEGLVKVLHDATTITIRIAGNGMFRSASDALVPSFQAPLTRVADALKDTSGPIIIAGHSDASPINTARFKSNMELSLARAETVLKTVSGRFPDISRLQAEGRSDREPIATNDTREGRAANRRIEIVLIKEQQS